MYLSCKCQNIVFLVLLTVSCLLCLFLSRARHPLSCTYLKGMIFTASVFWPHVVTHRKYSLSPLQKLITYMYVVLYARCPFCPTVTKIRMCQQILVKLPNMKFHENLSRSCNVPCWQIDQWTDMEGLVVTTCFINVPKMCHSGGCIPDIRRRGICNYHM